LKIIFIPSYFRNLNIWMYKPMITRVTLYGCEVWYIALRQEHASMLEMFGNKELRKLRGMKSSSSSPFHGFGHMRCYGLIPSISRSSESSLALEVYSVINLRILFIYVHSPYMCFVVRKLKQASISKCYVSRK
jgi:hypothetical protein